MIFLDSSVAAPFPSLILCWLDLGNFLDLFSFRLLSACLLKVFLDV